MCNKFSAGNRNGPIVKLAKIAAVLILFCFAECAAGSCISYGHSCWGAHGKRNDAGFSKGLKGDLAPNDLSSDTRWFLSRLLQAPESRMFKARDNLPPNLKLLLRDTTDEDDFKSAEDTEFGEYDGLPVIDTLFPDGEKPHPRIPSDKIHFLKFLKNNSAKMN